jgi:biopolymer transport protein ExbB
MVERRETEERISVDLENTYNENEIIKAQLFETLQERLGDLDELFGTIAGVVGDTRSQFEASLISAQYPGRDEFMTELAGIMASESQLPSIEQLERLWFFLLQEMTESASVARFTTDVAQPDGTQTSQEVVRIGSYNIVSNGQYLEYDSNTGRLSVLPSQPSSTYTDTAAAIQAATGGFTRVGIDPTGAFGGSYLAALISSPSFRERYWEQGRTIGQIIIFVGLFATLLAVERMITLTIVNAKVKRQLKNPDRPNKNNPLGRVLMVYEADKTLDIETLELKLGEAILLETPSLERFLTLLKIIATVAPLGGLLGTVTGMITVFQAITLFGTGDPQIMAGGISGALVTTVLGIVVAIPTILFHTIVKSRSDNVIHILEEQATGIIARRAEAAHAS